MATLLIIKGCSGPDLTDIYQRKDQKFGRVRMPFGGFHKYETTLSLLFQLSVVFEFWLACVGTLDTEKTLSRGEEAAPNSICSSDP